MQADFEGVVSAVAAPRYDLADEQPYFVFTIPHPKYPPGKPDESATFYLHLQHQYANLMISLVMSAYLTGADVQVGLVPGSKIVAWIQLPRAGEELGAQPQLRSKSGN